MSDKLPVELREDSCGCRMLRHVSYFGVQSGVQIGIRPEGSLSNSLVHALTQGLQLYDLGVRDALSGAGGDKTFHLTPDFGDLDGLLDRDLANSGTAIGLDLDQAVALELKKGVPDDESAGVELLRELGFDQPLPHAVIASQDPPAKCLTYIRRIAHERFLSF